MKNKEEQIFEESKKLRELNLFDPIIESLGENGALPLEGFTRLLSLPECEVSDFLLQYKCYGFWEEEVYKHYRFYYLTNKGMAYLRILRKRKGERE